MRIISQDHLRRAASNRRTSTSALLRQTLDRWMMRKHLRSRFEGLNLSQVHDVASPGVDGILSGTGAVLVEKCTKSIIGKRRLEVDTEATGKLGQTLKQLNVVSLKQQFPDLLPHDKLLAGVGNQVVSFGDHQTADRRNPSFESIQFLNDSLKLT